MMTTTKLDKNDLQDLATLFKKCFRPTWSLSQLRAFCRQPYTVLGTKSDGELIAFLIYQQVIDEIDIIKIAVSKSNRRQGIARNLLQTMHEHGLRSNASKVFLEVSFANHAAEELYRSLGYCSYGLRPKYYESSQDDALLMQRNLV